MQRPKQKAFTKAVGKIAKSYNEARAKEHRRLAAHKRAVAHRNLGHIPFGTGKWDDARQRGYEQRTERVLECGLQPRKMAITCQCCQHKQEVDAAAATTSFSASRAVPFAARPRQMPSSPHDTRLSLMHMSKGG
jgi:hypothetical protein